MNENVDNSVPNVVIGYDNKVYVGNFVPVDGTDYLEPVVPTVHEDGRPEMFRELELPLDYTRRLSALLVAKLAEFDMRNGLSGPVVRPVGPGVIDPYDVELNRVHR